MPTNYDKPEIGNKRNRTIRKGRTENNEASNLLKVLLVKCSKPNSFMMTMKLVLFLAMDDVVVVMTAVKVDMRLRQGYIPRAKGSHVKSPSMHRSYN
uniref:Transmembrane protein n=1 Tax=Syphacia muris TaxID=451379 RepID=A0A0N5AH29_9BILA